MGKGPGWSIGLFVFSLYIYILNQEITSRFPVFCSVPLILLLISLLFLVSFFTIVTIEQISTHYYY